MVQELAEDIEAAASSHIEETVQELAQLEGVEALVAEIPPREKATMEIRETSTLPEEEATTEARETSTLQESPKDSTSLNLQLDKEALMP